MSVPDPALLSRRRWLGIVSPPAFAAAGILADRAMPTALGEPAAPASAQPSNNLGARTYNIRDFGATGDGKTRDTAAIQAAIDACTRDGGGTVLVPAGAFLTGALELKSHVCLHIASSGVLLGSADGRDYHAVDAIPLHGDSTLGDGNWALLYAVNATQVTVEGPGTIDGQGIQFHAATRGATPPSGLGGLRRPYLLLFHKCTNLSVRGIELLRSAYHCVRIIQSTWVKLDGIRIHNRVNGNNDGFHFISAEHVVMSNCLVESQDDACALFGSCKFITITNCSFSTRWSVFRFGGGVAENISISNCVLYEVYGCPIKLHASPGSRFENIAFSNLVMTDVTGPIDFSVGPSARQNSAAVEPGEAGNHAVVRNISFNHIHGTVTTNPPPLRDYPFPGTYNPGELHSCITLNAVPGSVLENISFTDVHLTFGGGGTAEDAARRELPEQSGEYFDLGPMPAYGLYARNARGLTLNNVRLQLAAPDLRPAIILDGMEDITVLGLAIEGNPQAESVLRFTRTRRALLTACRVLNQSAAFLSVEGTGSEAITIDGGDLSLAASALSLKSGATPASVKVRL